MSKEFGIDDGNLVVQLEPFAWWHFCKGKHNHNPPNIITNKGTLYVHSILKFI